MYSCDGLPDEILLIILEKLNNIEVLCSLFNVNQRFNRILKDSIFTSHLTLFEVSKNEHSWSRKLQIRPLSDSILSRFCSQILPSIQEKIQWLDIEPISMEQILFATNYPNLTGLGLYNIDIGFIMSLEENNIFNDIKNQIQSLVIDLTKYANENIVQSIFSTFTHLESLKFIAFSTWTGYLYVPNIYSSILVELHIFVDKFSDCLFLLDGRFNQLRTFRVRISIIQFDERIISIKQEKLPNLKCFSLFCLFQTNSYDKLIVPFLQRMINLQELELHLTMHHHRAFIRRNDLKENILKKMTQLNKFTFHIPTLGVDTSSIYEHINESIQNLLRNFSSNGVMAWTDCSSDSGKFQHVNRILLFDKRPFERDLFVRIEQSFPLLRELEIENEQPQRYKLHGEANNHDPRIPIIKYFHLQSLNLYGSHPDYLEQFLLDTKIWLPNDVRLQVEYESLQSVTHNFQRNATRNKCSKMIYIHEKHTAEKSIDVKDYFARLCMV